MTDPDPTAGRGAPPDREVGMGHVVYDDRPPDAAPAGDPATAAGDVAVEEGSEESFPASDPSAFVSARTGAGSRPAGRRAEDPG